MTAIDSFSTPDLYRRIQTGFAPAVRTVAQTGVDLQTHHTEYQKSIEVHLKALKSLAESGEGPFEQANQFCKELSDITVVFEKMQICEEQWFKAFVNLLTAIVRFSETEKERVKEMTHRYFKDEKNAAKHSKRTQNPTELSAFHQEQYRQAQKQYCQRYAYFAKNYLELLRKLKESYKAKIEIAENQLLISDSAEALKNLEEVVNINDTLRSKISVAVLGENRDNRSEIGQSLKSRQGTQYSAQTQEVKADQPEEEETIFRVSEEAVPENHRINVESNEAYHNEIIATHEDEEEHPVIVTQEVKEEVTEKPNNVYVVHTTTTYTRSERGSTKNHSSPSTPHSVRRVERVPSIPASVQTDDKVVPIVPISVRSEAKVVNSNEVKSHSPVNERTSRNYLEEERPETHEYEYLAGGAKRHKVLPPGIYKPTPIMGLVPKESNGFDKYPDRYERFENKYQNASYHPQVVRPNVYDTDRPSGHSRQNSDFFAYHSRNQSTDSANVYNPIPLPGLHNSRQPPPKYIKPSEAPRPIFSTSNYGRWLEVVTSYEAQGEHQLSLTAGDRIKLIKSGTRGWVLGRTIEGRQGWYPAKFLRLN
ncbi:unnamed protein product [Bursaphelenchus xylophilus]|uniref:(pine wood nematode) hypothetical protein n=1 Tax=Bursaphelenchus xylophilus TaxID=6326 RepID=A0A1I7SUI9_BURXY|nr:unnamed protein product [Bursaphelenchus xylophilus]CAG9107077.1 unnamed protein product [Bursaphelenchus xylophilus]